MTTRIKICGITQSKDAQLAAQYGADAIGLVFYPSSPRAISPEQAKQITETLPPAIDVIGVFVNPTPTEIENTLKQIPLNLLQFHGDESIEFCDNMGYPYIKALRVNSASEIEKHRSWEHSAAKALLIDTISDESYGGTGQPFFWSEPTTLSKPLILAGGLTADNVKEALLQFKPYGVDVSSGVEAAPGLKDEQKIAQFIQTVRQQDEQNSR